MFHLYLTTAVSLTTPREIEDLSEQLRWVLVPTDHPLHLPLPQLVDRPQSGTNLTQEHPALPIDRCNAFKF